MTIPSTINGLPVTTIGDGAFDDCSSLTSITIPNSVTSIGSDAFVRCSSLTNITIPDSVTSIGSGAFYDCSRLTSITIPNGVTSIGDGVFFGCSSLTSITIPNGVTFIGDYAFTDCSSLTSITIPDSVTSIGNEAFSGCSSLTNITIGDSVTFIGYEAFGDCSSLTSITIPNGVTSIGDYAFTDCSSLTSITIPDSVTSIGNEAFSGCSSLTNITIGDSVTFIGYEAFGDCSSLTSITIPNGVTSIGDGVFFGCSSLTSITIPNSVTFIGDFAFSGCRSLTSITIPDSVTSIGDTAFTDCSRLTSITCSDSMWSYLLRANTDLDITQLTSITIRDSVTSIGDWAFSGCYSLTSITIPDSVTSIGNWAFSGCSSLKSITISSSVTSIGNEAFRDCWSLTSITIPSSVTSIGARAFWNCSSLTNITIPSSVTSIGNEAFSGCSSLPSSNGYQYVTWGSGAYITRYSESGSNVSIPSTINGLPVTSIGNWAFFDCSSLTNITIPSSVTSIGDSAFSGCESLTSITIPNSVTSIGDSAFTDCSSLTNITIPDSVTSIGSDAFFGCSRLPSTNGFQYVTWGAGVYITKYSGSASNVSIPSTINGLPVTSIGDGAFYGCYSLTSITIPNSVTSIGVGAFESTSLKSITIPSSVTSIGDWAFAECYSLTSITIGDSVTSIGNWAFTGCRSLTSITCSDLMWGYLQANAGNVGLNITQITHLLPQPSGPTHPQSITFPSIPTLTLTNGAYTLGATASSGLPITYSIGNSSVALITNGTLIPLGVGATTVTASQAGDTNWIAATPVTNVLLVTKAKATFTIPSNSLSSVYSGEPTFTALTNDGNTPLSISYNGSTTPPVGAGTYTVVATVTDTIRFDPYSVTNTLVIAPARAALNITSTQALYDGSAKGVGVSTVPAGLSTSVTYGGNTNLPTNAGCYPVVAVIQEANYVGSGTTTLTIMPASNAITFSPLTPVTYSPGLSLPLIATSTADLPVSFTSSDTNLVRISRNSAVVLGVGTTSLVAWQEGDSNHLTATPVTNSLVIYPGSQDLQPPSLGPLIYGSLPFGITLPTNASGQAVSARVVSGPATLSGTNLTITGTGTVTVAYDAPGNALYAPASVTNSFAVTNGPSSMKAQTITFKALASPTYGVKPIALAGTASSKLPLTYLSSNTNVALISGTTLTITGAGTSTITAYQTGDGTYNPAAPVRQTLIVNQASQKITLKAAKGMAYGSTPVTVNASASSGLPVGLTSSDPTLLGIATNGTNYTLTALGTGTVTLTAAQPGNGNFSPATSISMPFAIAPGLQTISFTLASTNAVYGNSPLSLTSTSSAGLPVTFTSAAPSVASIDGDVLTIRSAGKATITASQSGNNLWAPAKVVKQTLTIAKAPQTISLSLPSTVTYTNGGPLPLTGTASSGLPVAYKSGNAKVLTIVGTNCLISGKGTATVVATQAGGTNYLAAPPVTNTVTVQ